MSGKSHPVPHFNSMIYTLFTSQALLLTLIPSPGILQLKETTPHSGFVTLRHTSPRPQVQANGGFCSSWLECSPSEASLYQVNNYSKLTPQSGQHFVWEALFLHLLYPSIQDNLLHKFYYLNESNKWSNEAERVWLDCRQSHRLGVIVWGGDPGLLPHVAVSLSLHHAYSCLTNIYCIISSLSLRNLLFV